MTQIKRNIFSCLLKMFTGLTSVIALCRGFHHFGAQLKKAALPVYSCYNCVYFKKSAVDNVRVCEGL